jgi:hypothetical protein
MFDEMAADHRPVDRRVAERVGCAVHPDEAASRGDVADQAGFLAGGQYAEGVVQDHGVIPRSWQAGQVLQIVEGQVGSETAFLQCALQLFRDAAEVVKVSPARDEQFPGRHGVPSWQ